MQLPIIISKCKIIQYYQHSRRKTKNIWQPPIITLIKQRPLPRVIANSRQPRRQRESSWISIAMAWNTSLTVTAHLISHPDSIINNPGVEQFREALQLLKKAQKLVNDEVRINPKDPTVNKLVGITFNNLGCYYKKTHKPKVALGYLKKALEIQVYNVEDWISTAGTHLNICAIFSFMGRHAEAADHAGLSIKLLEREEKKTGQETANNKQSMLNILMISYYNLAVELEYLKQYAESKEAYKKSHQVSKTIPKAQNMARLLEESIDRVSDLITAHEKRMNQLIDKKREQEEKGYHEYMRRNKKNDPKEDHFELKPLTNKKYNQYSQARMRATSTADQGQMQEGSGKALARDRSEARVPKKKETPTGLKKIEAK